MRKKFLFIGLAAFGLSSCADLASLSGDYNPGPRTQAQLRAEIARGKAESEAAYPSPFAKVGTLVCTLDGPRGTPHFKPGYDISWETVLETDDYGIVHARRNMYLTHNGKRVTD